MKRPRSSSLRFGLTWRLIVLQILSLTLTATVLCILLLQLSMEGRMVDSGVTEIIAGALERQADGSLTVGESESLDRYRAESPTFWFVAVDEGERVYIEGDVPDEYLALAQNLGNIDFVDVRGGNFDEDLSAVLRPVQSKLGTVRVMAGGGAYIGAVMVGLLLAGLMSAPLLLILGLVTAVAIPLAVRRAMRGLEKAEADARSINFSNRGTQLSYARVPKEVHGLVTAVNQALVRLDNGYSLQQRFLADAAHELKTPLAILQARVENLSGGPDQARLLGDIARLVGLADQLLDLQRLARDDVKLLPVDLVATARQVVADIAPLAIAGGYDISLEAAPEHVWVKGDAGSLERLLVNLVQNAITHAGNAGEIQVTVDARGTLEVLDSGPGIPAEHRDRVFEPFYRVRPLSHGSGLGLNLARNIVHRHGGDILVFDSPAGGAGFRIRLPLAARETTGTTSVMLA
ncbi:sensor histidine kinase [Devosia lacusdianchii]|uniref:sensor histidine kinase n=1 Tax=Devosia lacusdianchii TaxID=2917991 RepID=UPI001F06A6F2|nr:HAMP domain-containing sensor histidine kinase [Devosia sp. JXJ CY 41]